MRILLASAYFPPDVGAASHLYFGLARAFISLGHDVSVVTGMPGYHAQGDLSKYERKLWLTEDIAGVRVHRVRIPQIAGDTPVGRGVWQFNCAIAMAVRGLFVSKPDVVLVYSPPLPIGLSALVWRFVRRVPFVLNVQDLFPQSAIDLGILTQRGLIAFFQKLERFLYQRADAITVHSAGNRDYVLQHGGVGEKTSVVSNTVDVDHIQPGDTDNPLRHELGLDGQFVVSFAGVMGFSQDLDTVVETAAILRGHNEIRFLLVGDGVEKGRLQVLAASKNLQNIIWLPMQPRERYPAILQASDVGLATLRADVQTPTVPSKILSIMAAGRPVVASMPVSGDAPKLIEQACAGVIVPPEDPEGLSRALLALYRDAAIREELGTNGRQYVVTHLSHVAAAKQYETIFNAILSKF